MRRNLYKAAIPTMYACEGLFATFLLLWFAADTAAGENHPWIVHNRFEDFASGTLPDGGVNTFISSKGVIQMIHRMDLNNDGFLDLIIGQDHDHLENVEVLIYRGSRNGPQSILPPFADHQPLERLLREIRHRNANAIRLPSDGGGRGLLVDLNGDKLPELVFCNYIHNYTVHMEAIVYWNSSEGYSSRRTTRLPTLMAGSVAAADFNKDGFIDLAFANSGCELGKWFGYHDHLESYIYLNGPLGFTNRNPIKIPTCSAQDCAAGDLNGDGYPELLFANNNEDEKSIYIYWNSADGLSPQRREIRKVGDPIGVEVIDADSDGRLDVVVMDQQKGAKIFRCHGDSLEIHPWVSLPIRGATECRAADLNRDGHVDLVFPNTGVTGDLDAARAGGLTRKDMQREGSYIYWGGDGGFDPGRRTMLPTLAAADACIADFNTDGWLDVAFANERDETTHDVNSYLYWNGPSGFDPACRTELQGFGAVCAIADDVDQDGYQDLTLINRRSGAAFGDGNPMPGSMIYWGNLRHFYSEASATKLPTSRDNMAIADLDQNGYVDIVFPCGHIYWGGAEGYSAQRRQIIPIDGVGVSVADLNRDGYLDLAFNTAGGYTGKNTKMVFLWGSKQGYRMEHKSELELNIRYFQCAAIADLNKDCFLDLVCPDGDLPRAEIFWGNMSGSYSYDRCLKLKTQSACTVETADLNADGWLDLIFGGSYESGLYPTKYAMLHWGGPQGYSTERSTQLEAYQSLEQVVADVNKDGYLDIIFSNYHGHTTRSIPAFIYWGNAEGKYTQERRMNLHAESSLRIDVADFNADTWLDLIIFNHQDRGDHGVGANIFWGGKDGYDYDRRHWIQTFGVHFGSLWDLGNIYDRRLREEYISALLQCPAGKKPSRMSWKARTPHDTAVMFQVRTAATAEELAKSDWRGPSGPTSYYERPGTELSVPEGHSWLQYKALMTTPDGGSTPLLDEVNIDAGEDVRVPKPSSKR